MPDLDQIKQGKQGAGTGGGPRAATPPAGRGGHLTQELHACCGGVALTGMGAPSTGWLNNRRARLLLLICCRCSKMK
jgi:hypothetical protein